MSKSYKDSILFISTLFILSLTIVFLTMNPVNKVMIDMIFMIGLSIFIVGGFLWIIEKGIYSRMFKNFKRYLKSTSKMEAYVENYDVESVKKEKSQKEKGKSIPEYMFKIGILLIVISAISAIL